MLGHSPLSAKANTIVRQKRISTFALFTPAQAKKTSKNATKTNRQRKMRAMHSFIVKEAKRRFQKSFT